MTVEGVQLGIMGGSFNKTNNNVIGPQTRAHENPST